MPVQRVLSRRAGCDLLDLPCSTAIELQVSSYRRGTGVCRCERGACCHSSVIKHSSTYGVSCQSTWGRDVDYQQPFISSCPSWQLIQWQRSKFNFCCGAVRPSALIIFGNIDSATHSLYPLSKLKRLLENKYLGVQNHMGIQQSQFSTCQPTWSNHLTWCSSPNSTSSLQFWWWRLWQKIIHDEN